MLNNLNTPACSCVPLLPEVLSKLHEDVYLETLANTVPYFLMSNPPVGVNKTIHKQQAQEVNSRTSPTMPMVDRAQ